MVSRVSTVGNYSAVLANLMAAQQRQIEAGNQIATQKQGSDLKAYAKDAEMLTAMRTIESRLTVYREQNDLIDDKLSTQDSALNQIASAAAEARQAIAEALASGRADTLMQDLEAQMRNAVEGLNARYGGKYLFAGGQVNTRPVSAATLSDLTTPATTVADFFHNDSFKTQAKIDESTTVTTGILAADVGTDMMTAFKAVQTFQEGGSGPFTGALTDAQRTFLEGQLAGWDAVRTDITNITGRNGLVQQRVTSVKGDLEHRADTLKGMMGDITDADMAAAATRLQAAQLSVQAAAQVFASLQNASLINLLK